MAAAKRVARFSFQNGNLEIFPLIPAQAIAKAGISIRELGALPNEIPAFAIACAGTIGILPRTCSPHFHSVKSTVNKTHERKTLRCIDWRRRHGRRTVARVD